MERETYVVSCIYTIVVGHAKKMSLIIKSTIEMKLRITLLFLILLLMVYCQDNEYPTKITLDKVVYGDDENQIGKYVYKNGELIKYEFYFNDKPIQYDSYNYTDDLLTSKRYYSLNNNGQFEIFSEATISYDLNNKLSEVLIKQIDREITYNVTWTNNHITKIERIENNVSNNTELEYNDKGNIIRFIDYSNDGSVNYILDCEYDNNTNPKYKLNDPTDIVFLDFTNSSPNNVISVIQRIDFDSEVYATTEIKYTYNDIELPKEMEYKITAYGETSVTLSKFFYKRIKTND